MTRRILRLLNQRSLAWFAHAVASPPYVYPIPNTFSLRSLGRIAGLRIWHIGIVTVAGHLEAELGHSELEAATVLLLTTGSAKEEGHLGHSLSATDYQKILLHRHDFCGNVRALFEDIDILVIPAQSAASPTLKKMETLGEDPKALSSLLRFTAPFDLTGSPALTMPAGLTKAGLPVAIQFVGRHFEEDALVRAGHAYQLETDWHHQHPAS